jgi:hypothetical protein
MCSLLLVVLVVLLELPQLLLRLRLVGAVPEAPMGLLLAAARASPTRVILLAPPPAPSPSPSHSSGPPPPPPPP